MTKFTILLTSIVFSCNDKTDSKILIDPIDTINETIDYTTPIDNFIPLSSLNPCDSVFFEPLAYGSQLRVLNNTLSNGSRKGKNWWQCKTFAWNRIQPTNYQQDSIKERIVIADIDTIKLYDTFYICRKKFK